MLDVKLFFYHFSFFCMSFIYFSSYYYVSCFCHISLVIYFCDKNRGGLFYFNVRNFVKIALFFTHLLCYNMTGSGN